MNKIILALVIAASANGATLVEVGPGGASVFSGPPIGFKAVQAVGFSLDQAYANVTIQAAIGASATFPAGQAYLTRAIGPTATLSDELQNQVVNYPIANLANIPLMTIFSGLSLDAGDYFLVFETPQATATNSAGWGLGNAVTTANGINFLGSFGRVPPAAYAPSSSFGQMTDTHFRFRVTGDATVPEPATLALTGIALLTLGLLRRRS
jgi:hypothetical protein